MGGFFVKVADAARYMGVSPGWVRGGIRVGRLPFGAAIPSKNGVYTYHIPKGAFEKYMGMTVEEMELGMPKNGEA